MDSALISDDAAARNRFENFKLGKGLPSTAPIGVPKHGHSRSHSRNISISSSFSFPPSKATTVNDMSHFSLPLSNANINGGSPTPSLSPTISPPCPSPTSPNLLPASKRNSHHRRRSSVSTRHESAEMMGVPLPDLPPSTSDDNINLGEKDSVRRRALWALEGKPDVSFNKVEIPDISTPDMEKIMFDFSSKASSTPSYGNGLNQIMGSKRDSFKLLGPSSSAKDQLHTLVEEEEEEEESVDVVKEEVAALPSPASSIKENVPPLSLPATPTLAITKPTPSKPRPSNLHLRPLSLTPENLTVTPILPSPSPTPSPRSGLRSLSLTPTSSIDESNSNGNASTKQSRRSSLVISPTPASKRPVLNLALEQLENSSATSTCDDDSKPTRRSSISYKRSSHGSITTNIAGLPTPEMTPTFGRRYSNASAGERESISSFSFGTLRNSHTTSATSGDDDFFPAPPTQTRPLSASEQHFLFKSHNALLARITDLERALMMRRRESGGAFSSAGGSSRPLSAASTRSSLDGAASGFASPAFSSEPSDEMLRLIADLKAERDELKRDADGWRTRVSDMETQLGVLAKRVENERREAWVARSRVGLLEVEKGVLSKKLEAVEELNTLRREEQQMQRERWEEERARLVGNEDASRKKATELEAELERVRKELDVERLMRNALIKEHAAKEQEKEKETDPLATPTPRSYEAYTRPVSSKTHGLGFASLDSESSITDVEVEDDSQRFAFKLGSVQEESESESEAGAYTYSEDTYYDDDEEENGLAGYEDEDEGDTDMSLQSSSSFDSEEDLPPTLAHLKQESNDNITVLPPSPTTPTPNQVFTPPRPTGHQRRATLSKTWTFPFGAVPSVAEVHNAQTEDEEEQDRFFGCLDDGEDITGSVPSSPSAYSYEKSKGAFARGFKFAPADDNASFFVPGIGFPSGDDEDEEAEEEKEQEQERRLSVVAEETEEDEEHTAVEEDNDSLTDYEEEDQSSMFGEIGGIRITFTPPQEEEPREERAQIVVTSPTKRTSPPPTLPALDFGLASDDGEDDDDTLERCVIPFSFGRSLLDELQPSPPSSPTPTVAALPVPSPMTLTTITPPSSVPRAPSPAIVVSARPASPSMIPRPASPLNNSMASSIPRAIASSKPVAAASVCTPTKPAAVPARTIGLPMSPATSFITPPTKRGGALPSFIPTPVSSPSPIRTAGTGAARTKSAIPTSTFIRQPTRKPLLPTANKAGNASASANVPPKTSPQPQSQNVSSYANYRSIPTSSSDTSIPSMSSSSSFYNFLSGAGNDATSSAQMKSVDFSHDHTFSNASAGSVDSLQRQAGYALSSIVASPFKSLTNFMPHTWATPPTVAAEASFPSQPTAVDGTRRSSSDVTSKVSGFVSREKLLRKLRMRMEVEGVAPMSRPVVLGCKSCDGALVFI